MVRYRNRSKRKGTVGLFYENGTMVYDAKIKPNVYAKIELKEVLQKAKGHPDCETLSLYVHGYKNIEIAKMKGQELNAVLQQCYRARKYLNHKLARY